MRTAVACLKPKDPPSAPVIPGPDLGSIPMTSRRSQLQEDTYFRVLRMLQDNPDMSRRKIPQAKAS